MYIHTRTQIHTATTQPCLVRIQTYRPYLHTQTHSFTLSGSYIYIHTHIVYSAMTSWSISGLGRHFLYIKSNLAHNHLRTAIFISKIHSTNWNRCHTHFSIVNYFSPASPPFYKFIIHKKNPKLYLLITWSVFWTWDKADICFCCFLISVAP